MADQKDRLLRSGDGSELLALLAELPAIQEAVDLLQQAGITNAARYDALMTLLGRCCGGDPTRPNGHTNVCDSQPGGPDF